MSGAALYAIVGEFADPNALVGAVNACRARYEHVDAYAPYAVEGLAEAVGLPTNGVPLITLVGGIAGGAFIYWLQWYTAVFDYPINAGGRPLDAWPVFIIPTFELAVLGAAIAAFVGMLVLNGLPRLNHPIFNAPEFDLASRNRFFVAVRASDPAFDARGVHDMLASLHPVRIIEAAA